MILYYCIRILGTFYRITIKIEHYQPKGRKFSRYFISAYFYVLFYFEKGENQRTQYKSNYQYAIIRRKKL